MAELWIIGWCTLSVCAWIQIEADLVDRVLYNFTLGLKEFGRAFKGD